MKELSEILQELIDSSNSDRIDVKTAMISIAEAYEAGMNKASKLINPSEEDNSNY